MLNGYITVFTTNSGLVDFIENGYCSAQTYSTSTYSYSVTVPRDAVKLNIRIGGKDGKYRSAEDVIQVDLRK